MNALLSILAFVFGLALLVKGADWLVHGAAATAKKLGVSSFVVGLTVVAFGTSAPELAAGISFVLSGNSELTAGAVIGSNIANVGLILGVTAFFHAIPCRARVVRTDVPIMLLVTGVGILVAMGGVLQRWEAALLAVGIVIYVLRAYGTGRGESPEVATGIAHELDVELRLTGDDKKAVVWRRNILLVGGGVIGLAIGSNLLIFGLKDLAQWLGVPDFVISLSMVAFGTSLPELAASFRAASHNEADIAIGNILGSNVFNILCVLGISGLFGPITFNLGMQQRDIWVMAGFALACIPIMRPGGKIGRLEGSLLVTTYLTYQIVIFVTAN